MIPAFIVNLPRDAERRAAMQAQFAALPEFRAEFVDAVDGISLPDIVSTALSGAKSKGTLGCFLSQVRVWERIAQLPDRFAVVLEDDADIAQLRRLSLLRLPEDFDILFFNDRMSPNLAAEGNGVADMATALRHLDMRKGTGADGYLLTPAAAQKLLAATAKDLYSGHVDTRLLRYAMTEADIATLPEGAFTATVLRKHFNPALPPPFGLLKGYATNLPLSRHVGWRSTRDAADGRPDQRAPELPSILPPPLDWPEGFSAFFPAMPAGWVDHALGRPAAQSSHCEWSLGADAAADAGRALLGQPQTPYAFHTGLDDPTCWQVDLGALRPIRHIILRNREDARYLSERATPLQGAISEDDKNWLVVFTTPEGVTAGLDGRGVTWSAKETLMARYVRISVPRRTWLHLRQVQVFGPLK